MVEYGSFRDLIWALIYSRNLKDDLEKLRYSVYSRLLYSYTIYKYCTCNHMSLCFRSRKLGMYNTRVFIKFEFNRVFVSKEEWFLLALALLLSCNR